MRNWIIILIIIMAVLGIAWLVQSNSYQESSIENETEDVAESLKDMGDRTREAVEEGADEVRDAVR